MSDGVLTAGSGMGRGLLVKLETSSSDNGFPSAIVRSSQGYG